MLMVRLAAAVPFCPPPRIANWFPWPARTVDPSASENPTRASKPSPIDPERDQPGMLLGLVEKKPGEMLTCSKWPLPLATTGWADRNRAASTPMKRIEPRRRRLRPPPTVQLRDRHGSTLHT